MAKKQKQTYGSFEENGQRYLQCKRCLEYQKVGKEIVAITCSRCVTIIQIAKFPDTLPKHSIKKPTGRPAGWHWMKEFVDKDGNVFHKGKEQPELKGTLKPTKVKQPKKRKKLSADEKLQKRITDWKKRKKLRKGKK
tara:strand:- start:104 stop:514 length:411 start_codon:yes stop_codon:yes gene_type:complete